GGMQPH
ncbi:hypothetical protein AVEN_20321-1, partial [Araneus ventricosus]